MKNVFITDFDPERYKIKRLFPLVRPFLNTSNGKWEILTENLKRWNCLDLDMSITSSLSEADVVLVSEPLSQHTDPSRYEDLKELNRACVNKNINAYVYIEGDYGKVHPDFSNITYYRMGGFKNQLSEKNRGFFPLLSDQLYKLFSRKTIFLRDRNETPTVGFCGHASRSIPKLLFEKYQLSKINLTRVLKNDYRYEPLFSSAYERADILKTLEKSNEIKTNFIFRSKYRAGPTNKEEQDRSTKEYFDNINQSDYVICLRGSGNFSIRFFESLMMGRIPVLINTGGLLPLEDEIEWKNHVVWVEWEERKNTSSIISSFHNKLSHEEFIDLQNRNRKLWEKKLTLKYYLEKITTASFVNIESCTQEII